MKNAILVACGQEDWWIADAYTRAAEKAYTEAHRKATLRNDTGSLEVLEEIRDALDQLTDRNNKEMFAETGIRVYFGSDGVDDSYYDTLEDDEVLSEMEDFDELAEAENADEVVVAAEQVVPPTRTSSPVDGDVKTQDAASSPVTPIPAQTPTEPSLAEPASTARPLALRSKKSTRWNKGGAYNAHQFTKSIGRSAGSGLARLYREWETEENKSKDRNSEVN
jgi:hypothetical protein